MWEFVEKVIYINLDHRQDRRDLMNIFFKEGNIPETKIIRFSAVKHRLGIVGCMLSHIGVLEMAKQNNWRNILILEDDVTWDDFQTNYIKLEKLIASETFDVCFLGALYGHRTGTRIESACGAHAYIVQQHYYNTLLNHYIDGYTKKMNVHVPRFPILTEEKRLEKYYKWVDGRVQFNNDVYWFKLQERDRWIGIIPSMCNQVEMYSDITNKISTKEISEITHLEWVKIIKNLM